MKKKKKKYIKELIRLYDKAGETNYTLFTENARLRDEMDKAIINFSTMRVENQKLKIENEKLEHQLKSSKAFASELGKENAHLRTENDLARIQLQDAQEKMRKPVFIPID